MWAQPNAVMIMLEAKRTRMSRLSLGGSSTAQRRWIGQKIRNSEDTTLTMQPSFRINRDRNEFQNTYKSTEPCSKPLAVDKLAPTPSPNSYLFHTETSSQIKFHIP
jgi:hypothetical protein